MPYTEDGLTAGKRDVAYEGHYRGVYTQLTLTDYESGGVTWDPTMEAGLSRVSHVDVYVADDSAYTARFDHNNNSIRLFAHGDGSEPTDGTTVNIPVRVRAVGAGP